VGTFAHLSDNGSVPPWGEEGGRKRYGYAPLRPALTGILQNWRAGVKVP